MIIIFDWLKSFNRALLVPTTLFMMISSACSDLDGDGKKDGKYVHRSGMSCASCHHPDDAKDSDASEAQDHANFKTGGTIFTGQKEADLSGALASFAKIVLTFADASMQTSNAASGEGGEGNFYFEKDYIPKDFFTPSVIDKDGKTVASAAKLGHGSDRFDCNRCHTAEGLESAPGRIFTR